MAYIKKLVIQGFKSFAKKTEILFDKGINTIVGPNGSGKSNISDALCFALGRLSIKSIRAAKAANLLFMGTKLIKPSREAFVEIIFDNTEKTFNIQTDDVSLKRIVKHKGQSIYKINEETKTRGDVIEMLAQAGIDPYGFNLILQGQIQAVVKMHSEERRKILEEVSGIAIYETRKQKSLHELEKTEERLKEISAVLRERTAFLKNLEKERSQALRYKELEKTIDRCKFSILSKKIKEKEKDILSIKSSIEEKSKEKDKIKSEAEEAQKKIDGLNESISKINNHIKRSTGVERESLQEKISDLRAELEGLKVRKESQENRMHEIEKRIEQMKISIPEYRKEIAGLRKESPKLANKHIDIKKKKEELAELEREKNKIYSLKTELNLIRERVREKESRLTRINAESDSLLKQIEELSADFAEANIRECNNKLLVIKNNLAGNQKRLDEVRKLEIESIRQISVAENQTKTAEETKERIVKLDTCPLCKNKMTQEHVSHVEKDSMDKIKKAGKLIEELTARVIAEEQKKLSLENQTKELSLELAKIEREIHSQLIVAEKKEYLKKRIEESKILERELNELKKKRDTLEAKSVDASLVNERYNTKLREIEEISSRTAEDLNTALLFKERELEKITQAIEQNESDLEDINSLIEEINESLTDKSFALEEKEKEEKELGDKFRKMFDERDSMQAKIQESNYSLSTMRTGINQIDEQSNYLKIGHAKLDAEKQALEMDLADLPKFEPINASIGVLQEKLDKARISLQTIGAINMRALEVYEGVKEEYERVYEKVQTLENEKSQVLKIIEEIDNKKKRTFMKTFKSVNELFSSNFTQLSSKGQAYLEIENTEDLFSGGINIVIKMGKGKYFDVTSLSGGEQTLVALSLLFAIQEHKPYHFYIFDEIDAALDKRNSERLANLLNKHIKSGQYIIVTHNDAIILNSNFLYGVSMHDGVSKVLSLKL